MRSGGNRGVTVVVEEIELIFRDQISFKLQVSSSLKDSK